MRITSSVAALLLLSAVSLLIAIQEATAQDALKQVNSEIDRLEQILKKEPAASNSDFAGVNSMIADTLKAARQATEHHQLYVALEKLGQATDLLNGLQAARDTADVLKQGLPAFESKWGKASLELTAFDKQTRDHDWTRTPAIIRALAESAQGRAIPLLDGGRGFATSTKPQDGLFYVGQAKGEAEFAKFCANLNLRNIRQPLQLRSFLAELQALQNKTNEAFHPPRSIDLHSRFIALNSTIKLAQELDASRLYGGALYEYLEATRHFGMLDATVPDVQSKVQLKTSISEQRKKLSESQNDDSILDAFLERAESQIDHLDQSPPTDDELRSSRVILDKVVPAYFAALKAPPAVQRASGKTVDITLVRWPYT